MSNTDFGDQEGPASAKEIQLRAAEWVMERREAGDWTAESQQSLDAWLAQSPAHLLAYWRLNATWERTHRLAALRHRKPGQEAPASDRQPFWSGFLRIAAACALIGAIGVASAPFFSRPMEKNYATPVGGSEIITLADGSRIELNTNTALRTTIGRNKRAVELIRGEAVFQVRHDANRPFVVLALGHRITDLGTKFSVRESAGHLKVALLEGRASFESADPRIQQHSVTMKPGDVVVATAETMSVTKMSSKMLTSELAWRSGMLIFDETPLADAVAEINRYNHEKLDIADSKIASLKIDGTFRIDNTRGFLDMAQHVLGLRTKRRGEKIVIFR